jgi:hypothetical protein
LTLKVLPFVVACVALVLAVLLELGAGLVGGGGTAPAGLGAAIGGVPGLPEDLDRAAAERDAAALRAERGAPPGLGVPYLALLDGLLLYAVALIASAGLIRKDLHAKLQGVATLVVSLLVLVAGIVMVFVAIGLLMLMLGLFLAAPFGTIAYLAIWGFFAKGAAAAVLGLAMTCKLVFAVALVLAHPRFLENRTLVLLTLTALLATFVVALLHGIVPGILASITDAVAAIVVAILAAIWALVLLIMTIPALLKLLRVDRMA